MYSAVMTDLETGGRRFDRDGIIQIAAVRFNLETGVVDSSDMFNRCLLIPPWRGWEESTRNWWLQQKPGILDDILARAEPAEPVMKNFFEWSTKYPNLQFWSKPLSFDFSFVSSYFADFGFVNPFHYRSARDLNSWIEARYYPEPVPVMEQGDFGDAHDALNDALYQLDLLFKHYENTKVTEKPPQL